MILSEMTCSVPTNQPSSPPFSTFDLLKELPSKYDSNDNNMLSLAVATSVLFALAQAAPAAEKRQSSVVSISPSFSHLLTIQARYLQLTLSLHLISIFVPDTLSESRHRLAIPSLSLPRKQPLRRRSLLDL